MTKDTIKLKKEYRRLKEDGTFKGSLKKFAKDHDLGQDWLLRKATNGA